MRKNSLIKIFILLSIFIIVLPCLGKNFICPYFYLSKNNFLNSIQVFNAHDLKDNNIFELAPMI